MKHILVICLLLYSGNVFAQDLIISGKIVDEIDREPIAFVLIRSEKHKHVHTRSNEKGYFHFHYRYTGEDELVFRHVGFEPVRVRVDKRLLRRKVDDTLYVHVTLPWYSLKELQVKNPAIPDTVFGSEQISIFDYHFFTDNRFILLAYEKNVRNDVRVILVDSEKRILSEKTLYERVRSLHCDYLGRLSVVCEYNVYSIQVFGNKLRLETLDSDLFYKQIAPVVDTANGLLYYSDFSPDFPAFQYYAYSPIDSSHREILKIEDREMMELYRSEYKYVDGAEKLWAVKKEDATGIDKEIWIGLKYFTNSLYYKSLYAPLFIVDNDVVVLDHYADMLFIYDQNLEPLDSSVIYYHKLKGAGTWCNQVIKDDVTDRLYTVLRTGGYYILCEIDITTGEIGEGHRLFYKYAENIKINNGKIHYIYRPFESSQKKFLYAENMVVSEPTTFQIVNE